VHRIRKAYGILVVVKAPEMPHGARSIPQWKSLSNNEARRTLLVPGFLQY
jgi:hypothetical protein